ncbi:NlpC/P60 family protein [Cryobacterium adonitolivorans]|uniref:NlpC/P60 family protein n=1 Tax=Cryobacterium adonitolivorans TaxID=1259189 RepID=A0A4R8W098_9MICO|nr:C40 family peptidase [Cryobacterium adonitolivorans]TFB95970.1 NlpC/P60 family protein [Cryobacterium adonitolivorans]
MTMVDALGRMGEIQARLVQLGDLVAGGTGAATSSTLSGAAASTAGSSVSATSFAGALAAATGTTATTSGTTGSGATGAGVVAAAEKYLGVPYVFGGEDSTGMDCSGLVQRVYADLGIEVPRLVSGQMTIGTEVASLAEAKPGDLIVTGGGDHILIYAGNNQVIHAPYEGRTVSKVDAYMDDSEITTIRRVIPDQAATAGVASSSTDLLTAAFASMFTGSASASALSTSGLSS